MAEDGGDQFAADDITMAMALSQQEAHPGGATRAWRAWLPSDAILNDTHTAPRVTAAHRSTALRAKRKRNIAGALALSIVAAPHASLVEPVNTATTAPAGRKTATDGELKFTIFAEAAPAAQAASVDGVALVIETAAVTATAATAAVATTTAAATAATATATTATVATADVKIEDPREPELVNLLLGVAKCLSSQPGAPRHGALPPAAHVSHSGVPPPGVEYGLSLPGTAPTNTKGPQELEFDLLLGAATCVASQPGAPRRGAPPPGAAYGIGGASYSGVPPPDVVYGGVPPPGMAYGLPPPGTALPNAAYGAPPDTAYDAPPGGFVFQYHSDRSLPVPSHRLVDDGATRERGERKRVREKMRRTEANTRRRLRRRHRRHRCNGFTLGIHRCPCGAPQ